MHSLNPGGGPDRLNRLADEYQSYLASIQSAWLSYANNSPAKLTTKKYLEALLLSQTTT